ITQGDRADFAWVTAPDPSGFVPIWGCGGPSNYLHYCNRAATKLLDASNHELNPTKRAKEIAQADALMAKDVPTIPLYSRPNPLIWKSAVLGMKNNPSGSPGTSRTGTGSRSPVTANARPPTRAGLPLFSRPSFAG